MIMDGFQREADAFVSRLVGSMQAEYQQLSRPAKVLAIEAFPERGEEFADSVADGVREVAATIEEQRRVTSDQQRALDNWESGVSRWLR